jgi:hypothetical protein
MTCLVLLLNPFQFYNWRGENWCYFKPVLLAAVAAPTVGFWKYFALWNFLFKKLAQVVYKPPARDPPLFVKKALLLSAAKLLW